MSIMFQYPRDYVFPIGSLPATIHTNGALPSLLELEDLGYNSDSDMDDLFPLDGSNGNSIIHFIKQLPACHTHRKQ